MNGSDEVGRRLADGGTVVSWSGWLISHITEVNSLLQTVLLVVSIVAGLFAIRYHHRRTPR